MFQPKLQYWPQLEQHHILPQKLVDSSELQFVNLPQWQEQQPWHEFLLPRQTLQPLKVNKQD